MGLPMENVLYIGDNALWLWENQQWVFVEPANIISVSSERAEAAEQQFLQNYCICLGLGFFLNIFIKPITIFFLKNIYGRTSDKNQTDEQWEYHYEQCIILTKDYPFFFVYLIILFFYLEGLCKYFWHNLNLLFGFMFFWRTSSAYKKTMYVLLNTPINKHRFRIPNWEKLLKYTPNKKINNFGIIFLYTCFKTFFIALIVATLYFTFFCFYFNIQFLKQIAIWFIVGNLFLWLISGFNYFLKRYKFGKFTSAIQRFWKRANMCFWLIEGFLFSIFFYYYLNASQEPLYMYDSYGLDHYYLLPLKTGYLNLLNLVIIIFLLYYIILNVNNLQFNQVAFFLVILAIPVFSMFFIESYQIYYILTIFTDNFWIFSEVDKVWELETDKQQMRVKHYYLMLCLIAKYWHFLFIFIAWLFVIMKFLETKKLSYNLIALTYQNFIILYALNLLCWIQWGKWVLRRFFDNSYFWFFLNPDVDDIYLLTQELYNTSWALISL